MAGENLIGKKIGPYRILEKLGQGGMGIVFKGKHEKLGRLVAIKMLSPQLAEDAEMRARFLKEARLQANLTHPNVVNLFDYLEEGGNVFLVMEYVEGETLEQMLLEKRRFSVAEVFYVARGVLEALAFMHSRGIVHRDIKPSNIIVSTSGQVKVTDFGIARLVREEHHLTRAGARLGTLYYMAPELLTRGEVTPQVDLYSLGVTLYQLLTGRLPFTGQTDYEIITAHLNRPPPPIRELNPEVPPELEAVILKALAKDPEKRYPSAEAFKKALQEAFQKWRLSTQGRKAASVTPFARPSRWRWLLIGALLLVLLLAALLYLSLRRPEPKPILPAQVEPLPAPSPPTPALSQEQEAKTPLQRVPEETELKPPPPKKSFSSKRSAKRRISRKRSVQKRETRKSPHPKRPPVTGWEIRK